MPSSRRARQREPLNDAFARVLEREQWEFDQDVEPQPSDGPASLDSSSVSQSTAAITEPISDLYRQHSHQQSMEGG